MPQREDKDEALGLPEAVVLTVAVGPPLGEEAHEEDTLADAQMLAVPEALEVTEGEPEREVEALPQAVSEGEGVAEREVGGEPDEEGLGGGVSESSGDAELEAVPQAEGAPVGVPPPGGVDCDAAAETAGGARVGLGAPLAEGGRGVSEGCGEKLPEPLAPPVVVPDAKPLVEGDAPLLAETAGEREALPLRAPLAEGGAPDAEGGGVAVVQPLPLGEPPPVTLTLGEAVALPLAVPACTLGEAPPLSVGTAVADTMENVALGVTEAVPLRSLLEEPVWVASAVGEGAPEPLTDPLPQVEALASELREAVPVDRRLSEGAAL